MKKQILLSFILVFYVLGYSQNNESIYPNFIGQNLKMIENNPDWKILIKSSGDLNKDGFDDFALILESKDSILEKICQGCKLLKNKPRIIVVLLHQSSTEKVIIQNNKFIGRSDDGGMLPYLEPELSIKNGMLTIFYEFTRSNQSYTFRFNNNRMPIMKAQGFWVQSTSGNFENDIYDFEKQEIISKTGNISKEKMKIEIIKFDIKSKSLSEFGEMFDWKIVENKYL